MMYQTIYGGKYAAPAPITLKPEVLIIGEVVGITIAGTCREGLGSYCRERRIAGRRNQASALFMIAAQTSNSGSTTLMRRGEHGKYHRAQGRSSVSTVIWDVFRR